MAQVAACEREAATSVHNTKACVEIRFEHRSAAEQPRVQGEQIESLRACQADYGRAI